MTAASMKPAARSSMAGACALLCAGLLALALFPLDVVAQEAPIHYADLLAAYKKGDSAAALSGLKRLTSTSNSGREVGDWLTAALRARDVAALELALMLHTEAAVEGFSEGATLGLGSWLVRLAAVRRIVEALREFAARTPFMRNWHLLWESMLQSGGLVTIPIGADFLPFALQDFPTDVELLLAAGSRSEMLWWLGSANPRRLVSGRGSDKHLRAAADMFRQSIKADAAALEPRLRLGRVLFLLDDLDGAEPELRRLSSPALDAAFRYLGLLFLGECLERRGDNVAADAAYRTAIGLVREDQSARIALAQLAHKDGRRIEAAEEIGRALGRPASEFDPWWVYLKGQSRHFGERLAIAQEMVRR